MCVVHITVAACITNCVLMLNVVNHDKPEGLHFPTHIMSDQIAEFIKATGASQAVARACLSQTGGNLSRAINVYAQTQPRRRPGASSSAHSAPRHRFTTFSDLANSNDDDTEFFNGGEKSGLAVTNPDDIGGFGSGGNAGSARGGVPNLVDELIGKAKQRSAPREEEVSRPQAAVFGQGGMRLGTEGDTPAAASTSAAAISASNEIEEPEEEKLLHRTMYFWRDGFSIDDGPLYRFDDAHNQEYLRAMSMGRAPIELLGAEPQQLVDVRVVQRRDEDYVKPKVPPSLNNASGGQRLGAATSVPITTSDTASTTEASQGIADAPSANPVSESTLGSEGNAAVQIRLADGTSRRLRFDAEGPVQQLYDYVAQTTNREFILQLPMPPQILADKQQSLKSAGAVGAVVVQRWA